MFLLHAFLLSSLKCFTKDQFNYVFCKSNLFFIEKHNVFTFVLDFLRFQGFFQQFESLVIVKESGVFRIIFGLYYMVQPAGRK